MDQAADNSAPAATGRSGAVTAVIVLVALLAGAATGAFGIGPVLGPASASSEEDSGGGGHGPAAAEGPSLTWTLDGIIINPAGSRGQHHLIATIAWKVTTAADEARLRAAEIELRDRVGSLLERNTLDQLTAPGTRDRLRTDLAQLVSGHLKDGGSVVYLPQFIVQ